MTNDTTELSLEETQPLCKPLLGNLLAQSVTVEGKSKAKSFVEVVHRVADGE